MFTQPRFPLIPLLVIILAPSLAFAQFGPTTSAPYTGAVLPSSSLTGNTNLSGSATVFGNAVQTNIQLNSASGAQQELTTGLFPNAAVVNVNATTTTVQDYGTLYSNNSLQGVQTTITVSNTLTSLPDLNTIVPVPATSNAQSGGGGIGGGGGYYYPAANNQTAVYIPTVTTAPLRPKTKSDNVKVLQWVLAAKGVYKGTIDGSYGPKTKTAVASYQKASGSLKADGYAGVKTLTHMGITVKMQ